jgi:hypothetical protein
VPPGFNFAEGDEEDLMLYLQQNGQRWRPVELERNGVDHEVKE